ncbi:endonuclease III [Candidatus Dojkabacteria bacterium]|uniref:Endonuclease III n=1 Tax=Candidatus Dojkabacteria bacterium TaxID=2099670 RepID=A0A955RLB3_9BACT|nr:endonuclease III [Candidatus Dojkabacteria bacterium]
MEYKNLSLLEKADLVSKLLEQDYPTVETPLIHKNEFELLIATILSPQTKDETTNQVTPTLFNKYPTAKKLSKANVEDVENIIRLVNYYRNKAKHVVATANMLLEKFNGKVPHTMDELIQLPGVGRKVANVVINEWFVKKGLAEPLGFVIDTHVLRVSKRLGLTQNTTPEKVEKDLMALFPKKDWDKISLRLIFHGREWSQAKNPKYLEHTNSEWREIYRNLSA